MSVRNPGQPAGAAKSLADDAQTLLLRTLVQHAEDNDDAAVSEAADSLLQSLNAPVSSLRYNKVHERLDTLFSIREKIIKSMARNEAEEDTTYTEAEWEVWLTTETFDRERMGKAIAIMRKEHFQPKNHKTQKKSEIHRTWGKLNMNVPSTLPSTVQWTH